MCEPVIRRSVFRSVHSGYIGCHAAIAESERNLRKPVTDRTLVKRDPANKAVSGCGIRQARGTVCVD